MLVEFDVKLDVGTLYDCLVKTAYSRAPGVMTSAAGAVLLLLFGRTGNPFCLAAGLIVLAGFPALLYRKAKKEEKEGNYGQPLHYRLTEDGVEEIRAGAGRLYRWEEMERALSTTKSVLLLTSGSGVCIFPREQLKDSLIPAVEVISTHIPARKVNIRM